MNFTFIESIWDLVTNILNIQNWKIARNDDPLKIPRLCKILPLTSVMRYFVR